jgi:hypothetical protein
MTLKTLLKTTAAIAALSAAGIGGAFAAPVDSPLLTNAVVTIESPIQIDEVNGLGFGTVTRPTTGTGNYTVSPSAPNSETVTGGDGVIITTGNRGNYNLTGIAGHSYLFAATTPGVCTGSGVSLDTTLTTVLDVGTLPSAVHVGGKLYIDFNAAPGVRTCLYTVAANYN